jgi:hypothetical protein
MDASTVSSFARVMCVRRGCQANKLNRTKLKEPAGGRELKRGAGERFPAPRTGILRSQFVVFRRHHEFQV